MSQSTPHLVVAREWDFLEPSRDPNNARTDHVKPKPAGAGLTVFYPAGQVVCQKDDGSNEWAKIGTAGYTPREGCVRFNKYPFIIDENGNMQQGSTWFTGVPEIFAGTVDMYWKGIFNTANLTGLTSGGVATNEVQTETLTATGGTRTLSVTNPQTGETQVTGAIAYNANAATIQAALEGLNNVAVGDIVVAGAGPFTYTFGGAYAGKDVALIVVGTGSLTGGTSTMVETTKGVPDNFTSVGRLIRGTHAAGEIELGVRGAA